MPYIGRPLQAGVRRRYIYAATAGQTSFSGNDSNGISLAYDDSLFLDVYQNGVLLKPVTDYTSTTGTSVVLTTGASTDDVLEMLVFDTFGVADTVSASNGGSFSGAVSMSDDLTVDSGTLFVDASANRVGIGTTSPSQLLSISDSGSARMEIISGTSGTSIIDMGDTADADIAGIRYAHDTDTLSFRSGNDVRMTISSDGEVLKPAQPAFHAYPDSNIAVSNSTSLTTFAANTEIYDIGSNYNTSTYKFTAPVTGKYLIKWAFRLDSSDAGATYYYYRIYTSNRTYDQIVDITSDETYSAPHNIAIVDLDANDEAYLQYQQYSGTNNHATVVSNSALTYIQGILLG